MVLADGGDKSGIHGSSGVSPGRADISQDIGDVVIAQGGPPGRHRAVVGNPVDLDRAGEPVKHGRDEWLTPAEAFERLPYEGLREAVRRAVAARAALRGT